MLAALALNAERAMTREELRELLWPGRDAARALRNLSYTLSVLRRRLKEHGLPDGIFVGARTMQLNPAVLTDRRRFEELLATALGTSDERRRELLEQAVAIYGSGLLPGLAATWLKVERDRLSRLHDTARRALVEAHALEGALGAATRDLSGGAWTQGGDRAGPGEAAPTEVDQRDAGTRSRAATPNQILTWAEGLAEGLDGPDRLDALDEVERRWPEVERAITYFRDRAKHREGGRLVSALWRYWYHRARAEDGRLHAEAFLAYGDWPLGKQRARLLYVAGTLAHKIGDNEHAYRRLTQSVKAWTTVDDDPGLLRALSNLALSAYALGKDEEAGRRYDEALAIAASVKDDVRRASLLLGAAQLAIRREDKAAALAFLDQRHELVRRSGDRPAEASTWSHRASALLIEPPSITEATIATDRALALYRDLGDVMGESYALRLLGYIEETAADPQAAERWYQDALALANSIGDNWSIGEAMRCLIAPLKAQARTDDARAMARGAAARLEVAGDAVRAAEARAAVGEDEGRDGGDGGGEGGERSGG